MTQRLEDITRQYDRVARLYRWLEPVWLILPRARRRAVAALGLRPGDTVLEIGAGTGRNLPYLIDAVGPDGRVVAVDASPGMLHEARRLIDRRGWGNVELVEADAARELPDMAADGVLFSLSYWVIPDKPPALAGGWERLRPGGTLAIMDAGLTETRLRPILAPLVKVLVRIGPGNAYTRPWEDLAPYGRVEIERFMLGIYFVCSVLKPAPRSRG